MSTRERQRPLLRSLPPDLIATIDTAAATAPDPNTRDAWVVYERIKGTISRAIGWDSPHNDHELYEMALQRYVQKAGL